MQTGRQKVRDHVKPKTGRFSASEVAKELGVDSGFVDNALRTMEGEGSIERSYEGRRLFWTNRSDNTAWLNFVTRKSA